MNMRTFAVAALVSVAGLPAAAVAQAPAKPNIAQGATVYGPQGGVVGTVERVSGDSVVVNTGTNSATLASSAFGSNDKGLTITFTRAQLDQAIESAKQAAENKVENALVVGAALRSMDGVPMGMIKSINEDGTVTVERESGPFILKREQFGVDANGLIVRLSAQQINAALAGTQSAPETAATTATANETAATETASAEATTE